MAGDIIVKTVNDAKALKTFVLFPWTSGIYKGDSAWVPPLISEQMKFLDRRKGYFYEIGDAALFLAYRNGMPVGRISAHVNRLYEENMMSIRGFSDFSSAFPCRRLPMRCSTVPPNG